MHPAYIQAEIHKRGATAKAIARSLGVSKMTVSLVIHGKRSSRRVAQEISEVTDIPLETLWPGRYKPPERTVA